MACAGAQGHMKETSSSSVTSLLQGGKATKCGLFKGIKYTMTWQQLNSVQKGGIRSDLKDTFFFSHGLDFP